MERAIVIDHDTVHMVADTGNIVTRSFLGRERTISQLASYAVGTTITPELTLIFACQPADPNADAAIATARADGWEVTETDADNVSESGWFTLRESGWVTLRGRSADVPVHVHVTAWRSPKADQIGALWKSGDSGYSIANRLSAWYVATGGQPWHTHPSLVAAAWLRDVVTRAADRTNRRHGVIWLYQPTWLPPAAGFGEWRRQIETSKPHTVRAYDGNGEWLAAESAVVLPYGKLEQIGEPTRFNPHTAGWWLVDAYDRDGEPHDWWRWATYDTTRPPLLRMAPNAEGRVWLSTPVMSYLSEKTSGEWWLDPYDAILPVADDKGRRRSGRILRPWAEKCRDARTAAITAGHEVLTDAVKAVYATLKTSGLAGARINRKDWIRLIDDTIMVTRHRRYVAGTSLGYALLATQADASWWAVPEWPGWCASELDGAMGLRPRHMLGGTKLHHKPLP